MSNVTEENPIAQNNTGHATDPAKDSGLSPPRQELLDLLYDEVNSRHDWLEDSKEALAALKHEAEAVRNSSYLSDARRETALQSIERERDGLKAEMKRVNRERNKFLGAAEVLEEYQDEALGAQLLASAAAEQPDALDDLVIDDEPAPEPMAAPATSFQDLMKLPTKEFLSRFPNPNAVERATASEG